VSRVKVFFSQFLIDILPLGSESVDPHIFAESDPGSQNVADPKHWFELWKKVVSWFTCDCIDLQWLVYSVRGSEPDASRQYPGQRYIRPWDNSLCTELEPGTESRIQKKPRTGWFSFWLILLVWIKFLLGLII